MISILKAPLLRGFFSLWLVATVLGAAKGVDSTHKVESADDESAVVDPRYVVKLEWIGKHRNSHRIPCIDTVDVTLNGFGKGIGGFDIKIGVENSNFHILEILPGELIDSCHWKLFTPHMTTNLPTTGLPLEVWQVIGLSQAIPDSIGPVCFGFDRPTVLMRLVVDVGPHDVHEIIDWLDKYHYLPIFFYWEDCTDNTISTESGDTLCVSSRVFDSNTQEISDKRPLFPSRTGMPRQCINPSRANRPHKLIDFYNGGIALPIPHPPAPMLDPVKMVSPDSSQSPLDSTATPK
ncbi:MAG: hypothetical protein AAB305_05260 [Candidatus Zixiibacteriota bacterium]